jgi:hypothetical protein
MLIRRDIHVELVMQLDPLRLAAEKTDRAVAADQRRAVVGGVIAQKLIDQLDPGAVEVCVGLVQ